MYILVLLWISQKRSHIISVLLARYIGWIALGNLECSKLLKPSTLGRNERCDDDIFLLVSFHPNSNRKENYILWCAVVKYERIYKMKRCSVVVCDIKFNPGIIVSKENPQVVSRHRMVSKAPLLTDPQYSHFNAPIATVWWQVAYEV